MRWRSQILAAALALGFTNEWAVSQGIIPLNTSLIRTSDILIGGSGTNRTVRATPVADQTDSSLMTLPVSDGANTTSISFTVQVVPPPPQGTTHVVNVNSDGSFSPSRVEIFNGDTVEWRLANRTDTIIPINASVPGLAPCTEPKPYNPADPNEFTGPLPRAVSGIFSLSPEEFPYATQDSTWQNPNLTGVFIRPRWDDVNPGQGLFNWAAVDAEIDKAVRNGKVFSIGFKAGVKGTPRWIFDPAKTDAVVTKLDFGFKAEGKPAFYGSPADPNYRRHYFDMLRAFASHLRQRNSWYRALAYIKPSGANLYTHENRLPNDTVDQLATWAGAGKYTPTALYQFYQEQEALLLEEFPDKDLDYALIQDGFPVVNDFGEYLGQSTPPLHPLPQGAEQTESILNQGRTNYGLRFVVAHNGLQRKPAFCPGSGTHPTVVDPKFHYVGSGCPNRWVLEQSSLGQITGFQTTNDLLSDADVDSALQNEWDNSDGIYIELYERNFQQADGAGVLPSGLTLRQWGDRLHERRRTSFPQVPDPLRFQHTFVKTLAGSDPQVLFYVNGSRCSADGVIQQGAVVILSPLKFTSVTKESANSVKLTLSIGGAGKLHVELSEDLARWSPLKEQDVLPGTVEVTDTEALPKARFYRATLINQ